MAFSAEQAKQNEIGIKYTLNHLNNSFNLNNKQKSTNKRPNRSPLTRGPQTKRSNINSVLQMNRSLILPFNNEEKSNEIQQNLDEQLKQLNKIHSQIKTLPSLKIAPEINDRILLKFLSEYADCKKNIYELECVIFKIRMYVKTGFIPKHE